MRSFNLAYQDTHLQHVTKELDNLTQNDIQPVIQNDLQRKVLKRMPKINEKLQEIYHKKFKDLGEQFKSKAAQPSTQLPKENASVQVEESLRDQSSFTHAVSSEEEKLMPKPPKKVDLASQNIPIGKAKALEKYKQDPSQCGTFQKGMIFKDIKHIELPHTQYHVSSVVGLMQYISGLEEVDLRHPLCERVVIDVLKECNKETSEELVKWLVNQKTFHPHLLKECLDVFIDKQEQQLALNPFSVELLIKAYKDKKWNQAVDLTGNRILPSNDKSIVSGVEILINNFVNEDRIISLTEWMFNQPDYDLNTFSTWIMIFNRKEEEKGVYNIYYPLLDKMLEHFTQKWGAQSLTKLNNEVASYVDAKLNPSAQPPKSTAKVQAQKPTQSKVSKPTTQKEEVSKTQPAGAAAYSHYISSGKLQALKQYKSDPINCAISQKAMIFNDIKYIELPNSNKNTTSVVGLMQYISESEEVDLHHPLCERLVIDVLKQCNKETGDQLIQWLVNQKTFHPDLLKECLDAFSYKYDKQIPFSLFSIELLIKAYEEKNWHQAIDSNGNRILPANSKSIVSAMTVLIKELPNEDRIISLTERMLNQPDYDLNTFSTWINIFRQREQEKAAINLYYPLLDKMLVHFNEKWGKASFSELDVNTVNYLNTKMS